MGKRMCGLMCTAALVAMLHAGLVVHLIHPWFHPQAAIGQVCTCTLDRAAGTCTCTGCFGATVVSGHAARYACTECPICAFLSHLQFRDAFPVVFCASLEVIPQELPELVQADYVSLTHGPAQARAPPSGVPAPTFV